MGTADVQLAADRLAAKLEELGIPYAICGGLALLAHGCERMTRYVDVLLTPEGLNRFKEEALGRGWLERFAGSRAVSDSVRANSLPADFADRLHDSVRAKYRELWGYAQRPTGEH